MRSSEASAYWRLDLIGTTGFRSSGQRTTYGPLAVPAAGLVLLVLVALAVHATAARGRPRPGPRTAGPGPAGGRRRAHRDRGGLRQRKSTLINILAGLDVPTAGSVRLADLDLAALSARQRVTYRRSTVGFIWQETCRNLLPYLTAAQNVITPMRFSHAGRRERAQRASELLELLGAAHCAGRRPQQQSGGEQRRVVIARALAGQPQLLIADEPTGQLDSETGRQIMRLLCTAIRAEGVAVLVAAHDRALIDLAGTVLSLADGRITADPA
ncbi:MAG TPA: ATP-binding cassette domain-containing protein [Streptosporangiaceae bacterium]|nr:ATP-binding cassette domain-containing protein [Streptosporangiaceae bacterium]